MELKEKLVSSFMAFEERIDVNSDLHEVRTSAIKNFENKGFPTKKEEAWKYTSLNSVLKNDFSNSSSSSDSFHDFCTIFVPTVVGILDLKPTGFVPPSI
jgi:hypothetical protein